ncbi:inositol monophosphatase family protein [Pilimelia terevasa]|nr:inositol monophosphatase family protein [Pilimelia terevasa]
MPGPAALAPLRDLAVAVVTAAAGTARRMQAGVGGVGTKSTPTDVVTAADRAVERQVVAALRAARPDDAVRGEEYGTAGAADAEVAWVLDPIDGTVNYLYGLPHYAISLAAEVGGVPAVGVVHEPVSGRWWTAVRGGGAFADGRRLAGSRVTDLGQALVGTGFAYAAATRRRQAAVLATVLPAVRDIRRLGSAATDLCLAAEGALDAYYESGLAPWDLAAGGLVAAEAGLRVTGLAGEPAGAAMVVAAPPALHGPLHDLLLAARAEGAAA